MVNKRSSAVAGLLRAAQERISASEAIRRAIGQYLRAS